MNWKGFAIGYAFGVVGLWLLALLALMLPFFETIGNVLFYPGRALAAEIAGANASTAEVILLMLINGALYGLIGAAIEYAYRKRRA
jgi:hypothetical protein